MRIAISCDENIGDTGTTAGGLVERDENIKVANYLLAALQRCKQDAWFDHTITYVERVKRANADGTDVLIACAHNAVNDPSVHGTVFVFCPNGHGFGKQDQAAQAIGAELVKAGIAQHWTTYDEAGIVECCDFNRDSIYCEILFQTNARDVARMTQAGYHHDAAEAMCRGLAATYGFAYIPEHQEGSYVPRFPVLDLQRDQRWAAQRLGTVDGATLGEYGCYVTSFAMMACYYGHHVTPAQLDDILTSTSVYESGDLMPDDGLARVYHDLTLEAVHDWSGVPADLGYLGGLYNDPAVTCILGLDFDHEPADGVQTHFVVMDSGAPLMIDDPWYGDGQHADPFSKNFGDPATTIQKAIVYRGPAPKSAGGQPASLPAGPGVMVSADWGKVDHHIAAKPVVHIPQGAHVAILNWVATSDTLTWQRVRYGVQGMAYEVWVVQANVRAA